MLYFYFHQHSLEEITGGKKDTWLIGELDCIALTGRSVLQLKPWQFLYFSDYSQIVLATTPVTAFGPCFPLDSNFQLKNAK